MFLNFVKSGSVLEMPWKNIACKKFHLEQKISRIYIVPVEENFDLRRERVPVHSLDIPF